jgi:hypothetical protein
MSGNNNTVNLVIPLVMLLVGLVQPKLIGSSYYACPGTKYYIKGSDIFMISWK